MGLRPRHEKLIYELETSTLSELETSFGSSNETGSVGRRQSKSK